MAVILLSLSLAFLFYFIFLMCATCHCNFPIKGRVEYSAFSVLYSVFVHASVVAGGIFRARRLHSSVLKMTGSQTYYA